MLSKSKPVTLTTNKQAWQVRIKEKRTLFPYTGVTDKDQLF